MKRSKQLWKPVLCICLCIGLGVLCWLFLGGSNGSDWEQQFDLGIRYLENGNYEQAVIRFTSAISIDPYRAEAYVGRGDAYVGLARYTEAVGDFDQALTLGTDCNDKLRAALQSGAIAEAQQNDLNAAAAWLEQVGYPDAIPAFTRAVSMLLELRSYCEAENYDAVFSILSSPEYEQLSASILGAGCQMYLIDENGRMIGIFPPEISTENFAAAGYLLYYGGQQDRLRSGDAVWFAYQNGNQYLAIGPWRNDRPNGNFETRSWQKNLNATVTYRIISGNVTDGLWNGEIIWSFDRGGVVDSYYGQIDNGSWKLLRYNETGDAVVADESTGSAGEMVSVDPDKSVGIVGFAQEA